MRLDPRNKDEEFNWKDALVDAAVLTGVDVGISIGLVSGGQMTQMAAVGSAVATFFSYLALKRGLKKSGAS